VLLLPTWTEGSALVTYEAMGAGCIPLVSNASGAPVLDGITGLLHEVGDRRQLSQQLDRLASQPSLLDNLRSNVVEAARSLTWLAAGQRLADAYRIATTTGATGASTE
jgi:glycosyltransferase involved in cell wall biosynthesis